MLELKDRGHDQIARAWSVLREAQLSPANSGQIDALELLKAKGADLKLIDFRYGYLRGVNLWGADLTGASLMYMDLRDAQLQRVTFNDADLTCADFDLSDLKGATFKGANLTAVDMRAAKNLNSEQLKSACSDPYDSSVHEHFRACSDPNDAPGFPNHVDPPPLC